MTTAVSSVSGTTYAIETEDLTRDFGRVRAVNGLTLRVPEGSVFGFLGPNGAGKSTTLRLLVGLLEPTRGRATVLGHDTRRHPDRIRQEVGVLLEHTGLYDRLSAEENLEFYARAYRLRPPRERGRELLAAFGLWDRRQDPVTGWSAGMRKRLAVARALLHRPALLLLDEPTAGLDPLAARDLRGRLAELSRREHTTVFLVTHNLAEADRLCDQVAVLRRGVLVAAGTPDELRSTTDGTRVRTDDPHKREIDLEDVFVTLMGQPDGER